jgi:hypothetical protein
MTRRISRVPKRSGAGPSGLEAERDWRLEREREGAETAGRLIPTAAIAK